MSRLSLKSVDDDVFGCIQMLVSDEQYESMQESEPDSNDIVCFSQKVYGFCWGSTHRHTVYWGNRRGPHGPLAHAGFSGTGKTRIVHKTRSFVFCCFRGLDLLERVTILSLPPAAAADDQEEGAEHIRRPPEPRELDVRGQKTFENELHPQSQPFVTAASAHQMATTQHNAPIENNISRPRRTFFFLFAQANKRRTPAAASAHSSQVRPEVPPIKTHPILFGVALLNETNYKKKLSFQSSKVSIWFASIFCPIMSRIACIRIMLHNSSVCVAFSFEISAFIFAYCGAARK
jgi:hypothetical protein